MAQTREAKKRRQRHRERGRERTRAIRNGLIGAADKRLAASPMMRSSLTMASCRIVSSKNAS